MKRRFHTESFGVYFVILYDKADKAPIVRSDITICGEVTKSQQNSLTLTQCIYNGQSSFGENNDKLMELE